MADTESILQLGIEAARAGDKEEARNLFRLLTRETPEDPQSWLWLAGVAEDREEKRAALEQVTQLDPSNELAQQGLAALGGPTKSSVQIPPAPVASAPPAPDTDFSDDFDFDFASEPVASAPPAAAAFTPPPAPVQTRELSPDEEFAMSLDSFGSTSNTYNERSKGGDADFNIPDFGFGDDEVDINAYMNRERVDMSQIQVSAEEGKVRTRKAITASDELKAKSKEKTPRTPRDPNAPMRASGGRMPLILMVLGAAALIFAFWWVVLREPAGGTVADGTATPVQPSSVDNVTLEPTSSDPNAPTAVPGVVAEQPTADSGTSEALPTLEPGTSDGTEPTAPPPATGEGFPTDPNLGGVQPAILPGDGSTPINVDSWFFNYGGTSGIADGNAINFQPQGRWLIVGALMFDGTLEGRTMPADLMVLKDAQGRVYRASPDASEAFLNTYPGSYNINLKQPAPVNQNFTVPLLFDVAPDATDLVLFSPQFTDQGYFVRGSAQ